MDRGRWEDAEAAFSNELTGRRAASRSRGAATVWRSMNRGVLPGASSHPVVMVRTLFEKVVGNCVSGRVAGPRRTLPDVLY